MNRKIIYPQLMCTNDYALFESHPHNRDISRTKILETSMKNYGFDPGLPLRCVPGQDAKYRITHGHHRFYVATKLKIDVWFVLTPNDIPLFESEASSHNWSMRDYAVARARAGDENSEKALQYNENTGIPLALCVSLVGGESAGSGNKAIQLKAGTYKAKDTKHADDVAEIVNYCRVKGFKYATTSNFVRAISKCLWADEFDKDVFLHKASTHFSLLEPRRSLDDYLDMIETVYNRQQSKKYPIAFLAKEASAARSLGGGK